MSRYAQFLVKDTSFPGDQNTDNITDDNEKQPSRGVLRKRCSENMHQI